MNKSNAMCLSQACNEPIRSHRTALREFCHIRLLLCEKLGISEYLGSKVTLKVTEGRCFQMATITCFIFHGLFKEYNLSQITTKQNKVTF